MQYYSNLDSYQINFTLLFQDLKLAEREIKGDEDQVIHTIKIGQNLDVIPQLPYIKGLRPLQKEEIIDYFNNFDEDRLDVVNGQKTNPNYDCYYCDYCNMSIHNLTKKEDYPHKYICLNCYTDMCHLCYSERSEEDALKNGAKNYHLRQEKLSKCQGDHQLIKIPISNPDYCICDQCDNPLIGTFWTDSDMVDYNNRFDLCDQCAKSYPDLVQDKKLKKKEGVSDLYYATQFGSLSDWIPIYRCQYPTKEDVQKYAIQKNLKLEDYNNSVKEHDMYGMLIYYNINKDSPNYKQLAISTMDDHGRIGIYQIRYFNTFEDLKEKIESFYDEMIEHTQESEWDGYYNNSINLLMDSLGMQYHFG